MLNDTPKAGGTERGRTGSAGSIARTEPAPGPKEAPIATSDAPGGSVPYDVERIRNDFPIFREKPYGKPLVYLDNAATTQKPHAVIERIARYYSTENANIHRGVHYLSQIATGEYEAARERVRAFLGAAEAKEIVFVRGTTEAVNLVAQTFGRANIGAGDEVLITHLEHHSNIVPWQILCGQTGATLKIAPIDDRGEIILEEYEKLLGPRTKLVGVAHVSNSLGTINPVGRMIAMAHEHGASVLVDGAQAAAHTPIDVQGLDCEFYAISGHKMFGPTGIGALYGKRALLETMSPYQGGGDMIASVTFEKTTYNRLPHKFEAGTPNIAGAIGLGAAIDYLNAIGLGPIAAHEDQLLRYATERVSTEVPGIRLIGTAPRKACILSFTIGDIHAHDVGTILDQEGVAIRAGHHCTQPVMDRFGVPATVRASFAMYNTREDADRLVAALHKVREIFG
jgi:cysteine desulfurase/selenocysteine lyase